MQAIYAYEFLGNFAISTVKQVYRTVTDVCRSYGLTESMFYTACQKGDMETVRRYVKKYGSVHISNGLLLSVSNRMDTISMYLINQGADAERGVECAIKTGNLPMIRYIRKNKVLSDMERYMVYMAENNLTDQLTAFLDEPCDQKLLNKGLKIACEKCFYAISELLVKKGASTTVGIRYAKTGTILRMIHRYEQKSENIN
jgi:hypothetical protein